MSIEGRLDTTEHILMSTTLDMKARRPQQL